MTADLEGLEVGSFEGVDFFTKDETEGVGVGIVEDGAGSAFEGFEIGI